MYALPRTPALQHASPVLNSYFEHALTTTTRILPSTRMASIPNTSAFTVSSPKNTSTAVFRSTNRPGTPLYTPPLCTQSYFPTLPTVHDKPLCTPHNTSFLGSVSTFGLSPDLKSARFEENIIEEEDEMELASSFSGLGLGIGNIIKTESTVFPSSVTHTPFTRKRAARPSFAHRISNMPLPELTLPKLRRGGSNVSTGSAGSEMTITGAEMGNALAGRRPGQIRWDSAALIANTSTLRRGTPHPGKMIWIEDEDSSLASNQ